MLITASDDVNLEESPAVLDVLFVVDGRRVVAAIDNNAVVTIWAVDVLLVIFPEQ